MKERAKRFFTEYSREKTLALILTVVLWIFMISGNNEIKDFTLKLVVTTGSDVILTSEVVEIIHVKATGSIFDFAGIKEDELMLRIDLTGVNPGIHKRFLDASMMPFDDGIKIEKIFPSELELRISPKAKKFVVIEPWLEGQLPLGWKLSGWSISPKKVEVEGPEMEIEELENVTTERIMLNKFTSSIEKNVKIYSAVPLIKPVGDDIVKLKIEVERDIEIRSFSKVPVKLDSEIVAEIVPDTVSLRLRGPKDILHKMESGGLEVFVKNDSEKEMFKVNTFFFKNMPEEVEIIEEKKPFEISVKKVVK